MDTGNSSTSRKVAFKIKKQNAVFTLARYGFDF